MRHQKRTGLWYIAHLPKLDVYLNTKIFRAGPGIYTLRDYGECLTVRMTLDQGRPDLNRSVNVLGFSKAPDGFYVSLAPGKKEATIVLTDPMSQSKNGEPKPYIQKASGWVTHFEVKENLIRMDYKGLGTGKLELSNLQPNRIYALAGNGLNSKDILVKSNEKGHLTIKSVRTGFIEVTW